MNNSNPEKSSSRDDKTTTAKMDITPADILAERTAKMNAGVLAHTGFFWVGCNCWSCRMEFDPTGQEDARRANLPPEPAGGAGAAGLQPARSVGPADLEAMRQGLPLPPPSPVLQRQIAVCPDVPPQSLTPETAALLEVLRMPRPQPDSNQ